MVANLSCVVRICISSTFRDFAGERDQLVGRFFPEPHPWDFVCQATARLILLAVDSQRIQVKPRAICI